MEPVRAAVRSRHSPASDRLDAGFAAFAHFASRATARAPTLGRFPILASAGLATAEEFIIFFLFRDMHAATIGRRGAEFRKHSRVDLKGRHASVLAHAGPQFRRQLEDCDIGGCEPGQLGYAL